MVLLRSCVLINVLFCSVFYLYYFIAPVISYTNLTLEGDNVCALRDVTRLLTVGKDDKSALIVRATTYFKELSGKYPLKCVFAVEASFNQGLIAVVQKMKLRRNLTTNTCIDYVQLCQYESNPYEKAVGLAYPKCAGDRVGPMCGDVALPSSHTDLMKAEQIAAGEFLSYQNPNGGISVRVYVSNQKLLLNESLELEIVFTAYKPCSRDIGAYKMCPGTEAVAAQPPVPASGECIYKDFFNDGIVNCRYIGCADECDVNDMNLNVNTKVTLTAATSILVSFFLFLGCMFVCRYFEVLCWSVQNLRGNQRNAHAHTTTPTNEEALEPSAPSLPRPHSPDKDLPPSYETLFPDR